MYQETIYNIYMQFDVSYNLLIGHGSNEPLPTLYPVKYAHGLLVLYSLIEKTQILLDLCEVFIVNLRYHSKVFLFPQVILKDMGKMDRFQATK